MSVKKSVVSVEDRLAAALVPAEKQPYPVPENWVWSVLGQITEVVGGGTPSSSVREYYEGGDIPWICPADLSNYHSVYIQHGAKSITQLGLEKSSARMLPAGSVCLSSRAPIGYVVITDNPLCTNQGFKSYLPNSAIVSEFLYWYLKANKPLLESRASGTTFLELSGRKAAELEFPLPPLPEQHRIVDRIESLFTKLDDAKERAQAVIDSYEDRKASILHRALTGELTEEWREKNNLTLSDWRSTPWGDFILSIEAGKNWSADGRPPLDGEFGVVKVSAVTWGEFNENESKTCLLSEQWNDKVQIHTGDFLFSRANTLQLVGNCVIVSNISKRLMLSDKILRLSFSVEVVPRYVLHFTRSDFYRKQIEELATGNQDGMRNIAQNQMRKVSFPIPTLAEQHEIVRILDSLLAKESTAKAAAEQAIAQIDVMKKSILARAFRGELGTNDPNDEPAIELLKRTLETRA